MKPRVIFEFDEYERPGLLHAVRRSTTDAAAVADAASLYQTMCGELLYSNTKQLSYKRGIPTCVRCTLALIEEIACL